jgi:chromate transporter
MFNEATLSPKSTAPAGTWPEVLAVFLRLGLTSFGGPVAHLGYFHTELVERRRWLFALASAAFLALAVWKWPPRLVVVLAP